MREKASDVKAERDALRRRAWMLEEALRAVTGRTKPWDEAVRVYDDPYYGKVRLVVSLIAPERAHGGIALQELFYHCDGQNKRDLYASYFEDWRSSVRDRIEAGCSSPGVWAEASVCEELTAVVSRMVA